MRRWLLIAALVAATVGLLAVLAWPLFGRGMVEARVRERLVAGLEEATGGRARIDDLRIRAIAGEARIRGLLVRDGTLTIESLEASTVTVRVGRFDLMRGRVRVRSVVADGVALGVAVRRDADTRPQSELDLTPVSRLEHLRVTRGRLLVDDESVPFSLDAAGLVITADPRGSGRTGSRGRFEAGPVSFSLGVIPPQQIERASARFDWLPPRIEVRDFHVEGPSADLVGSLRVGLTRRGAIVRGSATGTVVPDALLPESVPSARGTVRVGAAFEASVPGTWNVRGDLAGNDPLDWYGLRWLGATARFEAGPGRIVLADARARTRGGSRLDDLRLELEEERFTVDLRGSVAVPEALRRTGLDPGLASGTAQVRASATGPTGDVTRVAWTVEGTLDGTTEESAALAGAIEASGSASGSTFSFGGRWGETNVTARGGFDGARPGEAWHLDTVLAAPTGRAARSLVRRARAELGRRGINVDDALVPDPAGGLAARIVARGVAASIESAVVTGRVDGPAWSEHAFDGLDVRAQSSRDGSWSVNARLVDASGRGASVEATGLGRDVRRFRAGLDEIRWSAIRALLPTETPELPFGADPLITAAGFGSTVAGAPRIHGVASIRDSIFPGAARDGEGERAAAAFALAGNRLDIHWSRVRGVGIDGSFRGVVELPSGSIGPSMDGEIDARIDLARLPPEIAPEPLDGRLEAGGKIAWPGQGRPLGADGVVGWTGLRIRGLRVPDGSARFAPSDGALSVRARGEGLDVQLAIDAQDGAPSIEGRVGWKDLELVGLAERVRDQPLDLLLSIFTSGELSLSGPLLEPAAWVGRGTIARLEAAGPSFMSELEEPEPLILTAGGRLSLDRRAPLTVTSFDGGALDLFGWIDLLGDDAGSILLDGHGAADLRLLEVFDPDLIASGTVETEFSVSGSVTQPSFAGELRVARGRLRHLAFEEVVDSLEARLVLEGDRVVVQSATCRLGGGDVSASGQVLLDGWVPGRLGVDVEARDVALSVPRGIWGRYDADLEIGGAAEEPEIRGTIRVLSGRYSRPFGFGSLFTDRQRMVAPGLGVSSLLGRVQYRLQVIANDSMLVRNDMARLEASVRFDVSGTVARPLLSGAVSILEGGRFQFRGIDYEVLSGQVVIDDLYVDPVRLRVRAVTDIRGYRIRLDIDAGSERVDYQLSSTPALAEADILSLLITGETIAEGAGSGLIGPEVATAYFGSELGELLLAGTARRLLGVTVFQIAPSRVGPDARPTARLTLGRRIDDRTLALYSRDLSAEGEDLYRLERELTRRLRLSLSRESLGGVGLDLRFLKRFGELSGRGSVAIPERTPLGEVVIEGLPGEMREPRPRRLGLVRGKPLLRSDRLEARETLQRRLVEEGYLEGRVAEAVEPDGERARLRLVVDAGPRWSVDYVGPTRASRLAREALAELWALTGFRPELLRESERVLGERFEDEGYAAALIEISRPEPDAPRLIVSVDPGPRVKVRNVEIEGVSALPDREVRAQILSRPAGWGLGGGTVYRPRLVREDARAVRALYESLGWLEVRVSSKERFSRDGSSVDVTMLVEEGRRATVGIVRVEGNWPEELGPATPRIPLTPGSDFLADELEAARRALAVALDDAGWYDATVIAVPVVSEAVVDVTFRVAPGPHAVIEAVILEGVEHTKPKLVQRAVTLEEGEPLKQQELKATERALFALGLFRGVTIGHAPSGDDPSRRVVTIRVEEIPPVSLLGAIGYDTEERLRASAAISHDNLAGRGRVGSLQAFASDRRAGVRATLEDPNIARRRLDGLLALGWTRRDREGFSTESVEASIEIGTRSERTRRWQLRYVLEDTRFFDVELDPDALQDVLLSERGQIEPVRLGALQASFTLDRRDDPFLPGRGWVVRSDGGVWAQALLSEDEFSRINGQAALYRPLGTRLTLVGAARAGFAWPSGETSRVPLSERFFAGGADTLRGFERDKLGPLDAPGGEPLGGESLLLLNLEGRYRAWPNFEIAPFLDAGNAWIDADGFDPGDLRTTWGLSLRWRTPIGPLRLGYGRKLDRLPGESSGELFISIGEPF